MCGPTALDCDIWTAAIGADGYGRFYLTRDGMGLCVRPHRYALAVTRGLLAAEVLGCTSATTHSLGGSSVLRRLRAVAHDAGDRNEQSGTMLSPNNGEITPTGN